MTRFSQRAGLRSKMPGRSLWRPLVLLALLATAPDRGHCQEALGVTLGWDLNTNSSVVGYYLYTGNSSGVYSNRTDVGNIPRSTVSGVVVGRMYFFAAAAYDATGQPGPLSNELSYSVASSVTNSPPTLDPLKDLVIQANAGVQTITLTGISTGTNNESQTVTLTAVASNPDVVSNVAVSYASPGSAGTLSFIPVNSSTGSSLISVTANDGSPSGNLTTRSFTVTVTSSGPVVGSYRSSAGLAVPSSGMAAPYPSVIPVANLAGLVSRVVVTLVGVSHTWPDDLDIMLVSPQGRGVMLMSDCGGGFDIVNSNITLDDSATASLPDATQITAGVYKPTNWEFETALTGAPHPYGSALSDFVGADPNGAWSLYVFDDSSSDLGLIAGWSLSIETSPAISPTFANANPITILDNAAASTYPSTIAVSGQPGLVSSVVVELKGLSHPYVDDIEVLLVSPSGRSALVMANVAGSSRVNGVNIVLDDWALTALPDSTAILSGTYRPAAYGVVGRFPSPAPPPPFFSNLASLAGSSPNGTWSLYIIDDASKDSGLLTGGWALRLSTTNSVAASPLMNRFSSLLAESPAPSISLQLSPDPHSAEVWITLSGTLGQTCKIEASDDLISWFDLAEVTLDASGSADFFDEGEEGPGARFYRVRQLVP